MYSWVFFDWDGCIADTLRIWIRAYARILPNYGINASTQDIWEKLQLGNVPQQYAVSNHLQCRTDTRKVAKALFKEASLYSNAKDALTAIAGQCALGIVSNSPGELLHPVLGRYKINDLFSSVIAKEDMAEPKPHPEGILKTMELLRAEPKKTLFVGDSDKDLEAARRAGIDSALFYPSEHEQLYDLSQLKLHQPTHIVRSFKELELLVRGRGGRK